MGEKSWQRDHVRVTARVQDNGACYQEQLSFAGLRIEAKASCMQGKHSAMSCTPSPRISFK